MESIPSIALDGTLGAIEIGVVASSCLFGVATCQTYTYCRTFPDDAYWIKVLVFVVWCCELAHVTAMSTLTYASTITDFGQPQKLLLRIPPGLIVATLLNGIVGPAVQSFFACRIRRASGKSYIAAICWLLSAVRFFGCIVAAVGGIRAASLPQYIAHWRWLFIALLVVSAVNDIIIAASLCYYFMSERARALQRTAKALDRLIIWTIQTGLLTSVTTVAVLITCLAMPNNDIWLGLWIILTRLFANTLLAWLNQRIVDSPIRPKSVKFTRTSQCGPRTELTVGPVISIGMPQPPGKVVKYDPPYMAAQADLELGWMRGQVK
ncbi:hypothetical protein PLICRDRAFT_443264 [Plicaturopsis crispa FD-325 SS-3]|uniref:DUF6534 domain-containing protein n=1 Tax=Plicaturopsis crispa FD-325 SS-3 TaxID=944288 RepID=A0A0C9T3H2_PLICR|nr:hypothetical protein PLICRDRAFT_443264 [Plicaturopsis crispa FD-325 SS-3]